MNHYEENASWLKARLATLTLLALNELVRKLAHEKQNWLRQHQESYRVLGSHAGPRYTARELRAEAHRRLRVYVPALRYAKHLQAHLARGIPMENPQRLHEFLLAKVAGGPVKHLCQPPDPHYLEKTYAVAQEQSTALDILTGHPDVFGSLPQWVGPVSAYITPGPYSMTLQRLVREQAQKEFLQAKHQLRARIERELTLSPEELAVLRRM